MKRTLGILVATALLLSCLLSSTAFASDSCTLSVSVSAIENGKVTATVSIASNPGIASLAFSLKYDNTKLRSISATAGSTFSGALVNDETAPNEISYYWFSVSKLASTGSLMVVEFEIIEGDWTSTELVLSVADDGVTDGETTIPATVSNATVTKPAPAHTHTPGAAPARIAAKSLILPNILGKLKPKQASKPSPAPSAITRKPNPSLIRHRTRTRIPPTPVLALLPAPALMQNLSLLRLCRPLPEIRQDFLPSACWQFLRVSSSSSRKRKKLVKFHEMSTISSLSRKPPFTGGFRAHQNRLYTVNTSISLR